MKRAKSIVNHRASRSADSTAGVGSPDASGDDHLPPAAAKRAGDRAIAKRSNASSHYKAIAEYYDAENEHYEMLRQDVPFFLGHLPRRRQSVLEIAAGTGRAAIPIAQAGHRVVGIDSDDCVLEIARRKRDSVGVAERDLSLLRADALDLNLPDRFDWICIFFNTFLAFTDLAEQDALLQSIRRHLKPRGRFWIDIFQQNLALLAQDESSNLDPCAFHVPELNRTVYKVTDVKRDVSQQVQQVTFRYEWFDEVGQDHHEQVEFPLTFVFPRELQILLERNRLTLDCLYGNYDGSKLLPDSPRMIAMGRKAGGGD